MTSSIPTADIGGTVQDAALAESRRFLQCTLDALSAHIAVLDELGTIIAVNAAWISFARENDFHGGRHGLGANYLKICETAVGDDSEPALKMAKGIRAVMAGEASEFCLEYPCHSPQQQRWFIGRATRFTWKGPVRVVMVHENITLRKQCGRTKPRIHCHHRSSRRD
jgi:PAS domain-containing protein